MIAPEDIARWRKLTPRAEPLDLGQAEHRRVVIDDLMDRERHEDLFLIDDHGQLPEMFAAIRAAVQMRGDFKHAIGLERRALRAAWRELQEGLCRMPRLIRRGDRWSTMTDARRKLIVIELRKRGHVAATELILSRRTGRKVMALVLDGRVITNVVKRTSDPSILVPTTTPMLQQLQSKLRRCERLGPLRTRELRIPQRWSLRVQLLPDRNGLKAHAAAINLVYRKLAVQTPIPPEYRARVQLLEDIVAEWHEAIQTAAHSTS